MRVLTFNFASSVTQEWVVDRNCRLMAVSATVSFTVSVDPTFTVGSFAALTGQRWDILAAALGSSSANALRPGSALEIPLAAGTQIYVNANGGLVQLYLSP